MAIENKDSVPNETPVSTPKVDAKTPKKSVSVKKKKSVKKTAHHRAEHVSSSAKKSKEVPWKVITIILVTLLLILIAVVLTMNLKDDKNSTVIENTTVNTEVSNSNSESIELLIVEDPTCTTCQVDLFASQVKTNLIPTLEIKKVSIETSAGKQFLTDLKATQVPIYLFQSNIDKRDDWATNLAGAFEKVSVEGKEYYMLNPQFVQNKVMIEEIKTTSTAIVYGNANAKVTIYEFSDYECPFCAIAEGNSELVTQFSAQSPGYVPTMPNVYKDYVDKGLVKVVFYNMPLEQLHPQARIAHLATLCANEQGKWYEFHETLFSKRSDWIEATDKPTKFKAYAKDLGLKATQFDTCLDTKKYNTQIEEELALGAEYGVSGTPAFFVGKNFVSGAQEYSTMKALIDAELAK